MREECGAPSIGDLRRALRCDLGTAEVGVAAASAEQRHEPTASRFTHSLPLVYRGILKMLSAISTSCSNEIQVVAATVTPSTCCSDMNE